MGNSFVELLTSSAVLTEFGRGYRGSNPVSTNGEKREDVRKRMEAWNARVVRRQSARKKRY
jgi:hypothetical protein